MLPYLKYLSNCKAVTWDNLSPSGIYHLKFILRTKKLKFLQQKLQSPQSLHADRSAKTVYLFLHMPTESLHWVVLFYRGGKG